MVASPRDKIVAAWMLSRCVAPGGGRGVGTLGYSRMKIPFSNIGGVILIFYILFQNLLISFKEF